MRSVGTRELKQHTGEIVERVRNGERVVLTLRGEPVAVISPLDGDAIREAVEGEARKAERESLGWLAASESSFSFWENEDDEVWDEETEEPVDRAGGSASLRTKEIDEAVLALLYLNAFDDHGLTRAWKTFDWDAMDRLYEKGLIDNPKSKAKSVPLTPTGVTLARESFQRRFALP